MKLIIDKGPPLKCFIIMGTKWLLRIKVFMFYNESKFSISIFILVFLYCSESSNYIDICILKRFLICFKT